MLNPKEQDRPIKVSRFKGLILHADDDPVNRKLVRTILTKAGYKVKSEVDGRKCLDQLERIQPDLILMDIGMPLIDGITACRQIKSSARCGHIPVIFVTSYTDEATLQTAFDAGGNDYVRKPISRIELMARVNTALAQRRAFERRTEEEKLKGVLETAGAVCHELNQPLQYVLGALQLLMLDVAREDPLWPRLRAILASIEQMGDITRKLGDIACYRTRKYVGSRDIIDLEKAISSIPDKQ